MRQTCICLRNEVGWIVSENPQCPALHAVEPWRRNVTEEDDDDGR